MAKLRFFLLTVLVLLTSLSASAARITKSSDNVVVDFLVASPAEAITNNMAIANITVDRAYYDIYWTVTCATDPDFFFAGSCGLASQGAGTYTIKASTPSAEPVVLNQGRVYTFTFQTCEFGWDGYNPVASFEVTGSGAAAEEFSDITITSFDGVPGALGYQFKNEYTVTFSAPVTQVKAFAPLGMDGSHNFTTSKKDTEGCVWSINCSSMSGTEGAFELHIQARDLATGLRLRGTYGLDNSFIYTIYVSATNPDNPGDDPDLPDDELNIASINIGGVIYQLSEKNPIELASYPEGAVFTITLADEEIKKVSYEIIDHSLNEVYKSVADLEKGENGVWTAVMPRTYELIDGHEYYMHVVARDGVSSFNSNILHEYNFLVNGTNKNVAVYSSVQVVSITPNENTLITDEAPVISITFSEAIASVSATAVLGQMSSIAIPAENISTSDQITWQIAVPAGLIDGGVLSLNIVAIDFEGNRVTDPNNGVGMPENCYLSYGWSSPLSLPTASLQEDGMTVESIETLHFTYEGIGLNQDNNTATWKQIRFYRDETLLNIPITEEMFQVSGDESVGGSILTLTLAEPLCEAGQYSIIVPAMAFMLGHDQSNFYSGECTYTLTIESSYPEGAFILHEGDNMLPVYSPVTAIFKATEDCKVMIESDDQHQVTYNGQNYSFKYIPTNSPANVCEIDGVTAGSMVTLTSGFVMNPLVRITTFAMGSVIPLEVTHVNPATGTSDFWNNNGVLNISFNKQVSLTGAKMWVGEHSYGLDIIYVTNSIGLDLGPTLNELLTDGTLHTGDSFQIEVTGLREADNQENLYNGDGVLNLSFVAPEPQYALLDMSVNGQSLTTSGLNDYAFLSYYAPDSEDGIFTMEFETEVSTVNEVLLQMGNKDLDAQGKYYEGTLPFTIEGNKVIIDARGVLRTLSILFPAVVEELPEEGEEQNQGLGEYDHEHITLRVSSVVDKNGNYFRAQQAGNVGTYSFYMNYKELLETINLDGDNKMAGEEVWAGETISLWLSNADVRFDGIKVSYLTLIEEDSFEQQNVFVSEYDVTPDPYEGIIIAFKMPAMPDVAAGQTVRVSLNNAVTPDGMPHDLGIDYKAGDPSVGIETLYSDSLTTDLIWTINGTQIRPDSMKSGIYIINGKKQIVK